jgi:LuxR family maltose regulon positive regulatory protein
MFQGNHAGALAHLERLCADAEALDAQGLLIPALALEALALEQLGRRSAARAALLRAVTMGAPEGHVRSIVDAGPAIAPLLRALAQELPREASASAGLRAYVRRLYDAASPPEASAAPHQSDESSTPDVSDRTPEASLTGRELAILRLLAAGRSNREIADQLIIAVSTVKWYLRLIYDKLGAANRTEAVARARARGIIR